MRNKADIYAQVSEIMSLVLERSIAGNDIISMKTCGEWTSLKHIELILSLEEHFHIRFEAEDLPRLTSRELLVSKIESMPHD